MFGVFCVCARAKTTVYLLLRCQLLCNVKFGMKLTARASSVLIMKCSKKSVHNVKYNLLVTSVPNLDLFLHLTKSNLNGLLTLSLNSHSVLYKLHALNIIICVEKTMMS